eukprot:1158992-Pelagomonas_calceolata.AAC.2
MPGQCCSFLSLQLFMYLWFDVCHCSQVNLGSKEALTKADNGVALVVQACFRSNLTHFFSKAPLIGREPLAVLASSEFDGLRGLPRKAGVCKGWEGLAIAQLAQPTLNDA